MNILLMTSAAPQYSPFSTLEKSPPLGLGFLISSLKQQGHNVDFMDRYLDPKVTFDVHFLVNNAIEWVGIYANTICYQDTLAVLNKLQGFREKGLWKGKIMVGGPHTAVALETIPDFVDHVVIGEGEITVPDIVAGNETARVVKGKKVLDLDTLPFPAWEDFIKLSYGWSNKWIEKMPVHTFNTSRGCPFHCGFCSVAGVWGREYRFMSAERVLHDVERMIKDYGTRVAYFREDHFTLNKNRTIAFCESMLRRNLNIDWMCESRVDHFDDPDYVRLIARAGCKVMYIGVESGSPRMLEFMRKGETVEPFIQAFDLLKKAGIKTYASFVVGAPTETEKDLNLTYDLIKRIKPDFYGMNIFTGLPGSEFYDHVKENNLYAFKDSKGILYMKGHDALVNRFHHANPYKKIPYSDPLRLRWVGRKIRAGIQWRVKNICRNIRLVN